VPLAASARPFSVFEFFGHLIREFLLQDRNQVFGKSLGAVGELRPRTHANAARDAFPLLDPLSVRTHKGKAKLFELLVLHLPQHLDEGFANCSALTAARDEQSALFIVCGRRATKNTNCPSYTAANGHVQ